MANYSSSFCALMERNPILAADAQRKLVIAAQNGDTKAREQLITANLRFIVKQAGAFEHHRFNSSLEMDDFIIDGLDGLNYAIDKFDTTKDVPFLGYAKNWVTERMRADIQENGSAVYVPKTQKDNVQFNIVSLDAPVTDGDGTAASFGSFIPASCSVEEEYELKELREAILEMIANVAKKDHRVATIITAHYNLNGFGKYSFAAIGEMLGLSAQRVQQLHREALQDFASQPRMRELRECWFAA